MRAGRQLARTATGVARTRLRRTSAALALAAAIAMAGCPGDPPLAEKAASGAAPRPPAATPTPTPTQLRASSPTQTAPRISSEELRRLDRFLSEDDGADARRISAKIREAGATAVPDLLAALASGDHDVRRGAIAAARLIPREVLGPFVERLEDDDPQVRAAAADGIAAIGDWWASGAERDDVLRALASGLAGAGADERLARLHAIAASLRPDRRDFWQRVPSAPAFDGSPPPEVTRAVGACISGANEQGLTSIARFLPAAGRAAREWIGALAAATEALPAVSPSAPEPELSRRAELVGLVESLRDRAGVESPSEILAIASEAFGPACDASRRSELIALLESRGADAAPAVPQLVALVGSDGTKESAAASALDVIASIPGAEESFARAWIERVARTSEGLRAVAPLGDRADRALPIVREVLTHGDAAHRAAAAGFFDAAPPEMQARFAREFVAATADASADVRRATSWAWPHLVTAPDDPLVPRLLRDPDASVRFAAICGIRELPASARGIGLAREIVPFLTDDDEETRLQAGCAIEEIGVAPAECASIVPVLLRSRSRTSCLTGLRAAAALGPAATPLVPDLLFRLEADDDLSSTALDVLLSIDALPAEAKSRVRAWIVAAPGRAHACAWRAQGSGSFVADLVPAEDRADAVWRQRLADGGMTDAPEWGRFESSATVDGSLAAGTAGDADRAALVAIARSGGGDVAARAVARLAAIEPDLHASLFAELAADSDPAVRAAALFGCVAVADAGGDASPSAAAAALGSLDGADPHVRAAALHVLARASPLPGDAVRSAHARLRDADAHPAEVVAAADVLASAGDIAAAVAALRGELGVTPDPFVWTSPPGLMERDLPSAERIWCRVAGVASRLGPRAAPLAEDLAWTALRARHTLTRARLVAAVRATGVASPRVAGLIARVRPGEWIRDPFSEELGELLFR